MTKYLKLILAGLAIYLIFVAQAQVKIYWGFVALYWILNYIEGRKKK